MIEYDHNNLKLGQSEERLSLSENPGIAIGLEDAAISHGKLRGSEGSRSIGNPKNDNESDEDAGSLGKSGVSLKSRSGTLKEGSVGQGESGVSQRSRQNGSQTNETTEEEHIYERLSLSENPGAGNNRNSGGSGRNGSLSFSGNPGNAMELKGGAGRHENPGGN